MNRVLLIVHQSTRGPRRCGGRRPFIWKSPRPRASNLELLECPGTTWASPPNVSAIPIHKVKSKCKLHTDLFIGKWSTFEGAGGSAVPPDSGGGAVTDDVWTQKELTMSHRTKALLKIIIVGTQVSSRGGDRRLWWWGEREEGDGEGGRNGGPI